MPGPNSAPNGDRSLVDSWVTKNDGSRIKLRELLREQGKLRTGKTVRK